MEQKTYKHLETVMKSSHGTSKYHTVHPIIKNFIITDGVKYFADEAEAHWLCDIVLSYIPQIMKIDDWFFIVNLSVNKDDETEGIFKIIQEINSERHILITQDIHSTDLPTGQYEFYLLRESNRFVMLCKSEY